MVEKGQAGRPHMLSTLDLTFISFRMSASMFSHSRAVTLGSQLRGWPSPTPLGGCPGGRGGGGGDFAAICTGSSCLLFTLNAYRSI